MRLLIFTQKVDMNDDILGFFHSWLFEFSKKYEAIITVCLERGQYDLPSNVKVLSLGKEGKKSRAAYLFRFYKYIWQERKNYDAVFVHMTPIYAVLGGLFWRLSGKKIILWYTHRQVDFKLRLAEKFVNFILTASKESFCLKSAKVKILGHGIDTGKFIPIVQNENNGKFNIVYVGRISKIKNQELLIQSIDYLVNVKGIKDINVKLIGNPIYFQDKEYLKFLKELINNKNLSEYIFTGSAPHKEIADILSEANLSVNLCPTGGLDKAVLESMSCGIPVIVFNKSFQEVLSAWQKELILDNLDEKELAGKILGIRNWDLEKNKTIGLKLREKVIEKHSLDKLVEKITLYCK